MCGISGFNWQDEGKIRSMTSSLSYRGPDASDTFTDEEISLGHNRLSVIDLSSQSNQPMSDSEERFVIVFNGEIYNFQELRRELESQYTFTTQSDTEVILAGYKVWGKKVVDKLNGMFAFAIWDKRDKSLFCARDHMGMKPFYYYWDGERFIFASEMSTILTNHDVPRELDVTAFNHYMRILYVPEPMTMVKDIYKLPPTSTLTLQGKALSVDSYDKEISPTSISYEEAVSTLRVKMKDAVERHLISDVPVGMYLSGGIDSSTILSLATRLRGQVETFSVGFRLQDSSIEEKFNQDFNLAQRTAKYFDASHNPLVISSKDAVEVFEEVSRHNSDPISNPTSIAMFLLARFAKQKVTVVLTGNAGDELFGGYDRYRTAMWARFVYGRHNLFAKFMLEKDPKLLSTISRKVFMPSSSIKGYYKKYLVGEDVVDSLINADRRSWLPEHFFMLSDKMSMASALEERMPLADREMSVFARSLPRHYKVDMAVTKKVLRDAFKSDLPDFLSNQPKRGWFSPAAKWLREPEFMALAKQILSEEYYEGTKGLFNWGEVERMLERHIDKKEYNLTVLWAILTFQAWARHYKVA